jgi:phospholipid/cholesterol/gamma-HCH transport system permease protein
VTNSVTRLGAATLEVLRVLGHHAALFAALLRACGAAVSGPYLIVAQVHALGNLSVLIIVASGMAVGFVLRCSSTTRWSATARPIRSA